MFLYALEFKSDEKASDYEHYPSILVSFVGKSERPSIWEWKMKHFSGETKTSRKEGELFVPLFQIVRIFFFLRPSKLRPLQNN